MLILPEHKVQQEAMCKLLRKRIRGYYSDPEHRAAFEAWYFAKYGEPYVWKRTENGALPVR